MHHHNYLKRKTKHTEVIIWTTHMPTCAVSRWCFFYLVDRERTHSLNCTWIHAWELKLTLQNVPVWWDGNHMGAAVRTLNAWKYGKCCPFSEWDLIVYPAVKEGIDSCCQSHRECAVMPWQTLENTPGVLCPEQFFHRTGVLMWEVQLHISVWRWHTGTWHGGFCNM